MSFAGSIRGLLARIVYRTVPAGENIAVAIKIPVARSMAGHPRTPCATPQQALRTRCLARQPVLVGFDLPPRPHIRRAESTLRWEQPPPRSPEAPTYLRIGRRCTERDLP